jgi:glutamyl-tRNA synthetase
MAIGGGEAFWKAVRGNLGRVAGAADWWKVVEGPVVPVIADHALATTAKTLLPQEPWSETTWRSWTAAVQKATGVKGRALFMPLRQALTGLDHGPELAGLLPLIGRVRAVARLRGETA